MGVEKAVVQICYGLQANLPQSAAAIAAALTTSLGFTVTASQINPGILFFTTDTLRLYSWSGTAMLQIGSQDAVESVAGRTGDVTLAESDIANLVSDLSGKQASLGFTAENVAHKDAVNGYAGLDGSGLLKLAEAPTWNQNTTGTASGLVVSTTGLASPSPAYTYNEGSPTIIPSLYVQDANGNWHQQAGIDTTTANNGTTAQSGPTGATGTLTWVKRQFYRDTQASTQIFKNAFTSFNHAAGVGTSQENQDRTISGDVQNGSMTITGVTIASGTVTTVSPIFSGFVATGQIYTPAGLSTVTQLNNIPLLLTGYTTNASATFSVAPFTVSIANNASAGNTTYAAYINRAANSLAGMTFVVAGFTHSANNGTFTCVSNTTISITLNNPSGVSESPSTFCTATAVLTNTSFTSDSGNLDQYMYGMEVIQCELDINGTPTFTSAVDGEASAISAQLSAQGTGNFSVPALGTNAIRATAFKSGAGKLGGSSIVMNAVQAGVVINNTANNGSAFFVGVTASVKDKVGGAGGTIGAAFYAGAGGTNRAATGNYGLYVEDFSKSYTVTSVNNPAGGATVYNGSFATTNALAGQKFLFSGFTNSGNNGTFTCSASTSTTLTVNNTSAVAETKTVTIQALSDYAMYAKGGQVYCGGTLQLVGGFLDGTGSVGTNGQILSSTGSGTQWITPSTYVTSFSAGNLSPLFTTTVSTATTTPSLTFSPVNQNANLVYAGPSSGGGASPTFRSLALADLPTITAAIGGTGINSGSSTGVAQVNAGTWSVSTALASGTTASTQAAGDNSTNIATTAYFDTPPTTPRGGGFWGYCYSHPNTPISASNRIAMSSLLANGGAGGFVGWLMYVPRPITISTITYEISTVVAGGTVDIGLYKATGGANSLIASLGGVATNAGGANAPTTTALTQGTVLVPEGWYYFTLTSSTTTTLAMFAMILNAVNDFQNILNNRGSGANSAIVFATGTSGGVLPTTMPAWSKTAINGSEATGPIYAYFAN